MFVHTAVEQCNNKPVVSDCKEMQGLCQGADVQHAIQTTAMQGFE